MERIEHEKKGFEDSDKQSDRDFEEKRSTAELDKLYLEIEDLRRKNDWNIAKYLPMITALISVAGFIWGIILFVNQEEKDQAVRTLEQSVRIQNQVRADTEQLLQFPTEEKQTVSRALFLIQDLNNLIDLLFPKPEENKVQKDRITGTLIELTLHDSDFSQIRQVRLDIIAMNNWKQYADNLKGSPNNQNYLSKYCQALRELHEKYPEYLESVRYDKDRGYTVGEEKNEPRFLLLSNLETGFRLHLGLLQSSNDRAKAIKSFAEATNNPLYAADIRKASTGPSGEFGSSE